MGNRYVTIGTLKKPTKTREGEAIPTSKQRSFIQIDDPKSLVEFLKSGSPEDKAFIEVQKRPTDEEINASTSEGLTKVLTNRQEYWDRNPAMKEWKLADLVVVFKE